MQLIENFEQLKALQPKQRFYVLQGGVIKPYIFACLNPMSANGIIAIDGANYGKADHFSRLTIESGKKLFVTGEYNDVEIGELLVKQLKDEIEIISKIYIKPKPVTT